MKFENPLARSTGDFVHQRIDRLAAGEPERKVFERIADFRFNDYPDWTAPWHLLRWSHMRWELVDTLIAIIEDFKQPTGAKVGGPIVLEPFQAMILLAALGPEDPNTGQRIVKELLLTLARKNAKTTTVAAISLALMLIDPEYYGLLGQEIQVGAADREQAGITHEMISRFCIQDDVLGINETFNIIPSKKTLTHRKTMTTLKCLSSDAYRAHGGNPIIVLLDEIGNVPHHSAEEFYSVLTSGFGAQDEPLTCLFSTQAPNDQHFFSQQVDRCKRINEGFVDDESVAGFVFALPEVDENGKEIDPFDESLWYLANPGLGTICRVEDMRDWAKKARELPSLENKYRNLKLNQRVSVTAAFLSRQVWDANKELPTALAELEGCPVTLGLDLSETTDLTALVALFEPDDDSERFSIHPFFWIPGEGLEARIRNDKVPYDVWKRKGLIDTQSRRAIDYSRIANKIIELDDRFDIQGVGFDRWNMKHLKRALQAANFSRWDDEEFFVEIGQGFKDQTRSVQLLEEDALEGRLRHGNHPILHWNVANTVIVRDPANNRKFDKSKSYGRIDGCVALAIARHAREELKYSEEDDYNVFTDPNRTMIM